jgi:tRNA (guanine37-N1)-methyltransferase
MLKFDIITIFPEIFGSYFKESLIARAQKKKLIKINVHNLRKWTKDRHKTVDSRPFGGGFGMVMKVEPIYKAVKSLEKGKKAKVVLFTPRGKKFNQKMAYQFSKLNHIIMICGRYEGVDERVAKKIADLELSIGDYVLMGGEIPAMAVIEAATRLIPGVINKKEMLNVEQAQYARPEEFNGWRVPKVLLSGDHKKIEEWRRKHRRTVV